MFVFLLLTLVVELGANESTSDPRNARRVYGGEDDVADEFTFTVLLQQLHAKYRFCTGSLLSATWVLTAAHCFELDPVTNTGVRYGDFTALETHKIARVRKHFPHPNYSSHGFNDIALLLVEKIVGRTYVKLLAVDHKTMFGLPIRYAGFGRMNKHLSPEDIERMEGQLLPLNVGRGIVIPCGSYEFFKYSVVCVAPKCEQHQQIRAADSGAPLLYDGRLAAIARSIVKRDGIPISIFTPVCLYVGWIINVMREEYQNVTQNKNQ